MNIEIFSKNQDFLQKRQFEARIFLADFYFIDSVVADVFKPFFFRSFPFIRMLFLYSRLVDRVFVEFEVVGFVGDTFFVTCHVVTPMVYVAFASFRVLGCFVQRGFF